jgi:hypothetical protein
VKLNCQPIKFHPILSFIIKKPIKMTTLTKVIIGVVLSILLSSCNFISGVNGNGNVTNETISLKSTFNKVDAGHGLNVTLTKGNSQNVIVEADENLHDIIKIYVEDETLVIESESNIGYSERKHVFVAYTELDNIRVNSGAQLETDGQLTTEFLEISTTSGGNATLSLNTNNLEAKATSGGILKLQGNTNTFNAKATTGANLNADNLIAQMVEVKATTGANVKVNANKKFSADVSTGGNIKYTGNPEDTNISDDSTTGGNISKG